MQPDQAVYEEMLRRGSRGSRFWLAGSRLRSAGLLGIVLLLLVWPAGLYFRLPDIWLMLFLGLLAMAAVFSIGTFLKNISYRMALAEGLDLAKCLAGAEPKDLNDAGRGTIAGEADKMKNERTGSGGFTLIELMIVVAIIGILAAVAVPKFADLIAKSQEGATKGALATIRSALKVYYADNEGVYPGDDLACLTAGAKYLSEMPKAKIPGRGHADSNRVCVSMLTDPAVCRTGLGAPAMWDGHLGALWLYWEQDQQPPMLGTIRHKGDIWIGCTHLDSKGIGWSTF